MSPRNFRGALEARQNDRNLAQNSLMSRTQVEARVDVHGSGESRVEIRFPVIFSEKPIFTFGGELALGSTPEETAYPVISVMVLTWTTIDKSDQRTYYTGCEVGVVCLGKERQRAIAHCLFEGMAFRDPTVGNRTVGGPI